MPKLNYAYDEKKGYSVCNDCGGLVLPDDDDTYLGENEHGACMYEITYRCEVCGNVCVEVENG